MGRMAVNKCLKKYCSEMVKERPLKRVEGRVFVECLEGKGVTAAKGTVKCER